MVLNVRGENTARAKHPTDQQIGEERRFLDQRQGEKVVGLVESATKS